MSANRITLTAVAVLFSGNVAVEVPAGTVITVPGAHSRDELAEALAQNQRLYADNRDALTHEEVRPHVFAEGEEPRPARFKITYGLHGARCEELVGEVEAADGGGIEHTGGGGNGQPGQPGNENEPGS